MTKKFDESTLLVMCALLKRYHACSTAHLLACELGVSHRYAWRKHELHRTYRYYVESFCNYCPDRMPCQPKRLKTAPAFYFPKRIKCQRVIEFVQNVCASKFPNTDQILGIDSL